MLSFPIRRRPIPPRFPLPETPHAALTRRRVEFVDTDLEGMVHFARYLVYMETAEHELIRAAGATITGQQDVE